MRKRLNKYLLLSAAFALLLLSIIFVGVPIYAICNEERLLKDSLNNVYVDTNYEGWSECKLNGIGKIMLPNDWLLVQDGFTYEIIGFDGQQIAKGITIPLDNNSKNRDLFLEATLGIFPESVEFISDRNFVSIHSSRYGLCEVCNSTSKQTVVSFDIRNRGFWSLMLFVEETHSSNLLEIVQAISFSQLMLL